MPFDHVHNALNYIVAFVKPNNARAGAIANGDFTNVTHQHSLAALGRHHHPCNIFNTLEYSDTAHHQRLIAALENAATTVAAVGTQCLCNLAHRHIEFTQQGGIDTYLIFLDGAAIAHHVCHAGNLAQCRTHHPILQCAHFI